MNLSYAFPVPHFLKDKISLWCRCKGMIRGSTMRAPELEFLLLLFIPVSVLSI